MCTRGLRCGGALVVFASVLAVRLYQAWPAPQCGQLTLVETLALNR
jgi:hypothetical protein